MSKNSLRPSVEQFTRCLGIIPPTLQEGKGEQWQIQGDASATAAANPGMLS